jgi:hypothetical protein
MRRVRAALTALFLALLSVFAAGPASAGGPTSALLVWPDSGRTASLYASDDDYTELARLVGALEPDGYAGEVSSTGAGHDSGPMVTVTWLIHDVQVWRVDRIFPLAKGGPWVATQVEVGGSGDLLGSPVVWHTAADGPATTALLDRLGLGTGSAAPAGSGPARAGAAPEPADRPRGQRAAPASSGWPGWAWGLGGLAVGAGLAVMAARVASRRRDRATDDLPPWPVADELSSSAR